MANNYGPHAIAYCFLADDYLTCAHALLSGTMNGSIKLRFDSVIENNLGQGFELLFKAWLIVSGKLESELKNIGHDLINLRTQALNANFPVVDTDLEAEWKKVNHLGANGPLLLGNLERLNARYGPQSFRTRYPKDNRHQHYDLNFLAWSGSRISDAIRPKCLAVYSP